MLHGAVTSGSTLHLRESLRTPRGLRAPVNGPVDRLWA